MAVLLALVSAASFGSGDFLGGLAARRAPTASVVLWSYLLSACVLAVLCPITGGEATSRDLVLGAIAGLIGAGGIGLLYQALAIGPMGAVAPVTALLAAAVPVIAGVIDGERPAALAVIGMVAGAAAVVLVSTEGGGRARPTNGRGIGLALGAGLLFGLFFVVLSRTGDDSGLWPLLSARSVAAVAIVGLVLGGPLDAPRPRGEAARLTAGAGVFDVGGNVLYLLAIREGLLSVVTVLASLYPVATVVLAATVLRERFAPLQRAGMLLAIPATVLMAV